MKEDSAVAVLIKIICIVWMMRMSEEFTINFYACNEVSHYSAENICRPKAKQKVPEETYTLLQRQDEEVTSGFACAEIQSTFYLECGVWSHSKLMKTPQIERKVAGSTQTCRQWISSRKYSHPSGLSDLVVPGETIVSGSEIGTITLTNGKLACKGQTVKVGNQVTDDVIELVQTRVIIREVKVKSTKQLIEIEEDHVILPSHCAFDSLYCKIPEATYVWNLPSNRCKLKINKQLSMTQIGNTPYLVDEKEEVVLKKGSLVSSIEGCPIVELYSTEYHNLYLTPEAPTGFDEVTQVDVLTYVNTKAAYSFFLSEREASISLEKANKNLCSMKMNIDHDKEYTLQDGTVMERRGDLIYISTCKMKTENIKEGPCTEDIPIASGYVDARLKTFKKTSPPRDCGKELVIHANEAWIRVGPTLERVPSPERFPATHEEIHLFDFSKTGIYTEIEIEKWKRSKETQGLHQMLTTQIAHGACAGAQLCDDQPHIPSYDLNKLSPSISLDPFNSLRETLKEYGTYISALVLAIETVKFIVFLVMIMATLIQEGVQGLIALLVQVVCCASVNSYRKIRRNARRFEERVNRPHGAYVVPSMTSLNTSTPLLKPSAPDKETTTSA